MGIFPILCGGRGFEGAAAGSLGSDKAGVA